MGARGHRALLEHSPDVKKPTLLFEKSRESFLRVVYISHVIHIVGYEWVTVSS